MQADAEAVAYSYDVIPTSAIPTPPHGVDGTVDLGGVQLGNGSVFAALEAAGLMPVRALAEIHAASSRDVGSHHADDDGRLYLLLDQLHEDREGLPIAYSRTFFVEGRFQFVVLRTR